MCGRNSSGALILRGRCHKKIKKCAYINYKPFFLKNVALIVGIFRQITNSVFIALYKFGNGILTYCALTHGALPGQLKYLLFFKRFHLYEFFKAGCRTFIKLISKKTVFCQVAYKGDFSARYIRAAGTYTRVYQRYTDLRLISCCLPTKKVRFLSYTTMVTLGRNSNIKHKKQFLTKAGANIKKGFRSKVRGVAMNPVDHPHGGRTKSNSPERSP
jgi:large subunit ribosomal protein L2